MIARTQSESGLVLTINRKGLKNEAAGADVIHSHELLRLQRGLLYSSSCRGNHRALAYIYVAFHLFILCSLLYNISSMTVK